MSEKEMRPQDRARIERTQKKILNALEASVEGMTTGEIARKAGISRQTVLLKLYELRMAEKVHKGVPRHSVHRFSDTWLLGPEKEQKSSADEVEDGLCSYIEQKHAAWSAQFKPRRDFAASWF